MNSETVVSRGGLARPPQPRGANLWLGLAGLMVGVLAGPSAPAALSIHVGNLTLLPNTPGQSVAITVRNDGPAIPLGGLELLIQVADGGPDASGSIIGPRVDGVDLLQGTPFQGSAFGQFAASDNTAQRQFWNVIHPTATLGTGSELLLGTMSFDSSGILSGSWDLTLACLTGATTRLLAPDASTLDVKIVNGTLTVVPEPGATGVVMGSLLLGALFLNHTKTKRPAAR